MTIDGRPDICREEQPAGGRIPFHQLSQSGLEERNVAVIASLDHGAASTQITL
jgi:hypothetical protein